MIEEAFQQRSTLIGYFQGIVPLTYISHPYTYCLAHIAVTVGLFLAFHFKHKFTLRRSQPLVFRNRSGNSVSFGTQFVAVSGLECDL